ncbi:hypothetical protein AMAG_12212 [Allomyces macrogynus ATCC 38327]|uniref:Uncharacterized protein n=1 Tax=Allomyces macrogynus (strain ATCC 38327) TaxID=578462 RepID=A0A0L0SXU0_ALLM3|nr:hypothetical protein AMAG_12212 [Allomyces macrogynus ATCC 38327]|eukprot:KNE67139.1 hypothetical protein AMAG_12212 [Allomyces macrogynus ATCC 38327]
MASRGRRVAVNARRPIPRAATAAGPGSEPEPGAGNSNSAGSGAPDSGASAAHDAAATSAAPDAGNSNADAAGAHSDGGGWETERESGAESSDWDTDGSDDSGHDSDETDTDSEMYSGVRHIHYDSDLDDMYGFATDDNEWELDDFEDLVDDVDDVLAANVPYFMELPEHVQSAMSHYLARSLTRRAPGETEDAVAALQGGGDDVPLLELIEQQMTAEEFQMRDRADVFRFAMHALEMAQDDSLYNEPSTDDEDEDDSDSESDAPGDDLVRLQPDVDLIDEGGDSAWLAQICGKEYYESIRALDSAGDYRFLTRSPRWPILFELPSTANHFQCANGLALGPPVVRLDHLVLQQPITVEGESIRSHLDPIWSAWGRRPKGAVSSDIELDTTPAWPLSIAAAHGFVVAGDEEGNLRFFCHQPLKDSVVSVVSVRDLPTTPPKNSVEMLATAAATPDPLARSDATTYQSPPTPADDKSDDEEEVPGLQEIATFNLDDSYNSTQVVDGVLGGYFAVASRNSGVIELYHLPHHGSQGAPHRPPAPKVALVLSMQLRGCVNDAKISPDRHWLAAVGDHGNVWIARVEWDAHVAAADGTETKFPTPRVPNDPVLVDLAHPVLIAAALTDSARAADAASAMRAMLAGFTSQYIAWAPCAMRFAISSDTHPYLFIFAAPTLDGAPARLEHVIGTAQPTYAVAFHPHYRSILAVSNRHGFVQIIDIDKCAPPRVAVPEGKTLEEAAAAWSNDTINELMSAARRYPCDIVPVRHKSTSCQVNGLQWSFDGQFLYIATYERVLVYQFNRPLSLFDMIARRLHVEDAEVMADACRHRFLAATVGMEAKFRH